jgi:two-component system NtrC family sensor kinase
MRDNNRILIVDDDAGVRDSYSEILRPSSASDLVAKGASLFGEPSMAPARQIQKTYDLTLVDRGEKAVRTIEAAKEEKDRFAAAFIDMKMPGIDGAETAKQIWNIDPDVKIIIVTAYSEYTPDDIIQKIGRADIYYLRKPFNPDEIRQYARVVTNQWRLEQDSVHLSEQLKKANADLEQINEHLQKKVQEQTAVLVQSEKMASIGILAAGVAHEINNPVSFVNGNLTTLKKYSEKITTLLNKYEAVETCIRSGDKDRLPTLIDEIRELKEKQKIQFIMADIVNLAEESLEGTQRISNIVRDLKTFSRIDEADLKYIDLKDALEATLNIIHNELKNKVEIKKDYGELPEVRCFPQKISQVFMNILINAVQAIDEKGTIEIATRHVREGKRATDEYAEIRIRDSGRGIPQENLARVFDPFFTTKPTGQGTGLGLSITYDIIRLHGGWISVESEAGTGTTFIIRLPIASPPAVA